MMSIPQPLGAAGYGPQEKGLVTSSKQSAFDVRERILRCLRKLLSDYKGQKRFASVCGETRRFCPFAPIWPSLSIVRIVIGEGPGSHSATSRSGNEALSIIATNIRLTAYIDMSENQGQAANHRGGVAMLSAVVGRASGHHLSAVWSPLPRRRSAHHDPHEHVVGLFVAVLPVLLGWKP